MIACSDPSTGIRAGPWDVPSNDAAVSPKTGAWLAPRADGTQHAARCSSSVLGRRQRRSTPPRAENHTTVRRTKLVELARARVVASRAHSRCLARFAAFAAGNQRAARLASHPPTLAMASLREVVLDIDATM
jgi:hypothetical protein